MTFPLSWFPGPEGALPAQNLPPGLYLVPTPVGNLGDITLRALHTLARVDRIAAEDTRVTRKLMHHYGLKTPLVSFHDHSSEKVCRALVEQLRQGGRTALVSDAGTPLVSDPGHTLVARCLAENIPVIPLPGASSVLVALTGSGLPQHAFTFAGFIPARQGARRRFMESFCTAPHTLVFFETPNRLKASLETGLEVWGDRPAVIARELTKKFETFHRGTLARMAKDPALHILKGELVLLVAGCPGSEASSGTADQALDILQEALETMPLSQAVRDTSRRTGLSRQKLYRHALALQAGESPSDGSCNG